jgi:hypothetical protein
MTDSERYTGGHTMPPFHVMHGSMWKEPQTLEECTNTKCGSCAYYGFKSAPKYEGELPTCEHRETLIYVELVK